ncbi:MAG: hypothetical protein IPG57_06720 [Burkholderiales bacterium]|jgi:hypothetical protein|nr:hypothetical protein [Burkholderiales bacterium]
MSTPSTGAVEDGVAAGTAALEALRGGFVEEDGESWYRIDGCDAQAPFFMALAGDSDLWAFVSSAGSLAAGRRDAEGAFLPYETVDKIHLRWEHTGPRSWIRVDLGQGTELWQPFAPHCGSGPAPQRSVWKTLSGTRIRFRELHPSGRLVFQQEWCTAADLGLLRSARLWSVGAPVAVQVLDGVLNLLPPNVGTRLASTLSSLTDAYKWNETAAGGRLGLFTLYAQIWDRAEPKESFHALVAWHAGLPAATRTLLSAQQVHEFCRSGRVQSESLTRGRRGAFLVQFDTEVNAAGCDWHLVIDAPYSQVQAAELARSLAGGDGTPAQIAEARARNEAGLAELLARADGLQTSGDPMAAAHHQANVLFNIMRGGVFVDGVRLERDDLCAFARQRHRALGQALTGLSTDWPVQLARDEAMARVRDALGPQGERLLLEYLPLTFSRRHGDPSRPWNRFSIRVRDAQGRRVVDYQGNWRDIFQNWEALAASEPAYLDSMVAVFLGAMTPDGYNPYRIGRDGIDWEVVEPDDPWSFIGYWGDHQVVYLLKLLEATEAHRPGRLAGLWDRALFSFADVPYRLKPHAEQTAAPKATIHFDHDAHHRAQLRAQAIGADGLRVCDDDGLPVLATLGEKLATIVLAKAGNLLPGGGLWLHTQRPEWNDANNALVGNGLSVVTLAHLRRFLAFVAALPGADAPFALPAATLQALTGLQALLRATPHAVIHDAEGRRRFLDAAGELLDPWRAAAYQGAAARVPAQAPAGLLTGLAQDLLPLVEATLRASRRDDGLYHAYNLVDLATPGRAEVSPLYPMLEGQVAMLSSGLLSPAEAVALLDALFASPLYCPRRRSFMLYPDRALPGFLLRNRLDAEALALPVVQRLLADGREDLLQRESDGTVRFAPGLSNRGDLEAAGADLGPELAVLAQAYERVLDHAAFTGRSGTMFGYEGLGCIYWHMVAKLLLAVQEQVFVAHDAGAPELPALVAHYRRVRDGLGYRKSAAEYGAFPADPYSHTPGEGGAQQPGMTGQVKEEILTRWGELGLRLAGGRIHFCPVLTDAAEVPAGGALEFTFRRVPWRIRLGAQTALRVLRDAQWREVPGLAFDPQGVTAVEAWVAA